jgi:hypothetical protein
LSTGNYNIAVPTIIVIILPMVRRYFGYIVNLNLNKGTSEACPVNPMAYLPA